MSGGTIGDVDILVGADATPFEKQLDSVTKSIAKTVSDNLSKIASTAPQISKMVSSVGSSMEKTGATLTNSITKPILGASAAAGGLVSALGFKRLVGIDTARGQFKGLGYDADAVMKQVDAGVTNTALSMAQGASAAVGILATGAVPLEGLEAQLKRVANVSAAYQIDAEQAANLLNKTLTKGKVEWGDLVQMQENGIPIVSQLAKQYGVAGDAIMEMAQEGLISIDDLNMALDTNAGAAAEAYANTWKGITANILSNLGKIGAKFLEPTFEIVKEQAAAFLEVLRSPEFAAFAERWGNALAGLLNLIIKGDFSARLREAFGWQEDSPIVGKLLQIRDAIIGLFNMIVKGDFSGHLRDAFGWEEDSPIVGFLQLIHDNLGTIIGVAVAIGPAFSFIGALVSGFGTLLSVVGPIASTFGSLVGAFGGAGAAGGGLLSTLLRFAGPVGLIVSLFITMWTQSEEFRTAIMKLLDVVGTLITTIASKLAPVFDMLIEALVPIITQIAELAAEFVTMAADLITALMPVVVWIIEMLIPVFEKIMVVVQTVFDAIVPIIQAAMTIIEGIIKVVTGIISGDWGQVWEGIKQIFVGIWDLIVAYVTGVVDVVLTTITVWLETLAHVWGSIWGAIRDFFTGLWDAMKGYVEDALLWVGTFILDTIENIKTGWRNAWTVIVTTFENIWNQIKTAASNFMTSVQTTFTNLINYVQGIPDRIMSFFLGIGSWLYNSGKSLIEGFLNGIKSMFETAKSWVEDGLQTLRDLFPFSPAKTGPFSGRGWVSYAGESVGSTFVQSTAEALTAGQSTVADALGGIADQFTDSSALGVDLMHTGQSMADQLAAGLNSGVNTVEAAAAALAQAAQDEFNGQYGPALSGSSSVGAANQLTSSTAEARRPAPAAGGGSGGDGTAVFHLYDSDGVLMGTIDGRIGTALQPGSARALQDTLGV